eukprot:1151838-Pelagomonas_calceolata.AAC.6
MAPGAITCFTVGPCSSMTWFAVGPCRSATLFPLSPCRSMEYVCFTAGPWCQCIVPQHGFLLLHRRSMVPGLLKMCRTGGISRSGAGVLGSLEGYDYITHGGGIMIIPPPPPPPLPLPLQQKRSERQLVLWDQWPPKVQDPVVTATFLPFFPAGQDDIVNYIIVCIHYCQFKLGLQEGGVVV